MAVRGRAPVMVVGTDRVLRNLNRRVSGIKNRSRGGMRIAVMTVLGAAKVYTPVRFGHLVGDTGTEVINTSSGPVGVIYYNADYAVYVHERTELRHKPPTMAKFLETALKEQADNVIRLLKDTAGAGL